MGEENANGKTNHGRDKHIDKNPRVKGNTKSQEQQGTTKKFKMAKKKPHTHTQRMAKKTQTDRVKILGHQFPNSVDPG